MEDPIINIDSSFSALHKIPIGTKRIVVIGRGRFGTATAQGLRKAFVYNTKDQICKTSIIHVSARDFTTSSISSSVDVLRGASFVVYCGYYLPKFAHKIAVAMKEARMYKGEGGVGDDENCRNDIMAEMEFIDFSNPDPVHEKYDLTGAIDVYRALMEIPDTEVNLNLESATAPSWKVWKINQVGTLEIAGTEGLSEAIVYGAGVSIAGVPKLVIPNLNLVPAPEGANDLFAELNHRIMERAAIDRWYDGLILSFAMYLFTATYAIFRYHYKLNGSEPTAQIPMYLLDKAFAWTGLWMMVVSPFAGNLLALSNLWSQINVNLGVIDVCITVLATLIMVIPVLFFSITYVLWVFLRNMFFFRRGHVSMYCNQDTFYEDNDESKPHSPSVCFTRAYLKSTLIDMVSLKGETGCVGFAYALIHSFIGLVVCDVSYKGYWFNDVTGRLNWNMELCMATGCVSTVLLWVVSMRSIMGSASWIRLKPLYSYVSPAGMWFAVVHIIAFGAKGWTTLLNGDYHNGQMSITFVSSMYPACTLIVHHLFGIFETKKHVKNIHLWSHSLTSLATIHSLKLKETNLRQGSGDELNFTNHSVHTGMGKYLPDIKSV